MPLPLRQLCAYFNVSLLQIVVQYCIDVVAVVEINLIQLNNFPIAIAKIDYFPGN